MENEKRLIDANALIEEANAEGAYGYVDAFQIANAPTIDAVEVRHGRWVEYQIPPIICCSNCDWATDVKEKNFNYCPNCGAKMDGGAD